MSVIKFKRNFQLYFENKQVYFNVWNIVLRNKWKNDVLASLIRTFRRHLSQQYCVNSVELKWLNHRINLFSLEDMKKCIKIQQETSLLMQCSKLVFWNCIISAQTINYSFRLKSFSEIIFED